MENSHTLFSALVVFLFCLLLYRIYIRRNDGDYRVINQKVVENEKGHPDCSIDLLHIDNGKLLKDLKVSWQHQVLCTNPAYSVRIKNGILYLFKKGHPDYAQKEEYILLERKDNKELQES